MIEIRHSKKNYTILLISFFALSIYLLTCAKKKDILPFSFFLVTVSIIILLKIFGRNQIAVISCEGIRINRGKFYSWQQIKQTFIEEVEYTPGSYFRLILEFNDGTKQKISLDNVNYCWEEVGHIVESFKTNCPNVGSVRVQDGKEKNDKE